MEVEAGRVRRARGVRRRGRAVRRKADMMGGFGVRWRRGGEVGGGRWEVGGALKGVGVGGCESIKQRRRRRKWGKSRRKLAACDSIEIHHAIALGGLEAVTVV